MNRSHSIALALAFSVFTVGANAQTPPPAVRTYTLSVSEPELAQIGAALGEKPYKEVAGLLTKLQKQYDEQNAAQAAAANKPADKPAAPPADKKAPSQK